jgi:succinyl-CoA synthetase beta subunit
MIGYNLVTQQTKKEGLRVNAVLVNEGIDIKRQIYLAFVLDRTSQKPALIVSKEGGVEIEEVAKHKPDAIHNYPFDYDAGLTEAQLNDVVK